MTLCAITGLTHCHNEWFYSITSSAMDNTSAGIERPGAFAVFRLMTSSNFVDCMTGRSVSLAPLRICPRIYSQGVQSPDADAPLKEWTLDLIRKLETDIRAVDIEFDNLHSLASYEIRRLLALAPT